MDPAVRIGIKARYAGACGLCGAPVDVGERIFQLPKKRTGAGGRWVCAACRFPEPDRVIDVDFLVRKLEKRLLHGPSYTPTMAEFDLMVTVMGYIDTLDEDQMLILCRLQEAQRSRRCPTFGRAKQAILHRALRGESEHLGVGPSPSRRHSP